jgi:TPR repeat protein
MFSVNAYALETINQSENVFRFQQKLAKKGNAYAQYKLATMYETGDGVEADINKAKQWYQQASAQGVKAASDRITYLVVEEQGFNKAEHMAWLEGVEAGAKKREVESMHMLGQLYHKGIGVKKNLEKSLALLTYVSSTGGGNVESEIALIHDEIDAEKIAREKQRKSKAVATRPVNKSLNKKPLEPQQAKVSVQKKAQDQAQAKAAVDSAKKQAMIEKRRRYEKVMAQIKLEQQIINEQQAQVTGGQLVAIDDEF